MTDEQFEALTDVQKEVYNARVTISNTLFNMTRDGRLNIGNIEAFSTHIHYNLRLVENILKRINAED